MSAIDNIPSNPNFLNPGNFRFYIKKTPTLNFFLQEVPIPDLTLEPSPDVGNPFQTYPEPGDHLTWGPLNVTFRVDEDLLNYLEIYNWLTALGFNKSFDQYQEIARLKEETGLGKKSDLSLLVLNSAHVANYDITFIDGFPVRLGGMKFATDMNDIIYMVATATFNYTRFEITRI